MLQVILHYYCTGHPPDLKFNDGSNSIPSCGNTTCTTRQKMSFNAISTTSNMNEVNLHVRCNGGHFYLTEVQFFNDSLPRPDEGMYTFLYNTHVEHFLLG